MFEIASRLLRIFVVRAFASLEAKDAYLVCRIVDCGGRTMGYDKAH